VRINNRGPFRKGRLVDVSKRAAQELGMIKSGVAKVELAIVP
jgi:rare lipoprotein A